MVVVLSNLQMDANFTFELQVMRFWLMSRGYAKEDVSMNVVLVLSEKCK